MFTIGAHLSVSNGYLAMAQQAVAIGANTFQFFTRNPRGGAAKPLDMDDIDRFVEFCSSHGISTVLAHAPYTLNACAKDEGLRNYAQETMADDLRRLETIAERFLSRQLPITTLYNFHPGSHVQQGTEIGISYIADMLNHILSPRQHTIVLLETMAGKGSEVGRSFEELRQIIDRTRQNDKIGVCLDTCHVNDAGYDIVNHLDDVVNEFDNIIGLQRLRAIHLNDSKNPLSAHKDRHELIGKGFIGADALRRVINHPALSFLPFFLETPNDVPGYADEISLLKTWRNDN